MYSILSYYIYLFCYVLTSLFNKNTGFININLQIQERNKDGTNPIDLKNWEIFHFTDKLLLHNMAASSGLRENVYPVNFFMKMFIFIILLLSLY